MSTSVIWFVLVGLSTFENVFICIRVYLCTCLFVNVFIFGCTCTYIHLRSSAHVCVRVRVRVCSRACVCAGAAKFPIRRFLFGNDPLLSPGECAPFLG